MKTAIFSILPAMILMTACGEGTPPTISSDDIAATNAEFARVDALPVTSIADLPTGSAGYSGKLGGPVRFNGDSDFSILGDLEMTVDFAIPGALTGTISEINLIEDGAPQQLLGGELDIAGTAGGSNISATATGDLQAVETDSPFISTASTRLTMSGNVRTDDTGGNALVGGWSGGTFGSPSDQYTLTGGGSFFATSD